MLVPPAEPILSEMSNLMIAIVAAIAGSAVTLAWEGFLKPKLAGRMLAEMIAADLSQHLQSLEATRLQLRANPRTVPYRWPAPTLIYTSIVSRLGELPRDVVGRTIQLYRTLERLNEVADQAANIYERLELLKAGDDAGTRAILSAQLARETAQFEILVDGALARMQEVQPMMIGHAMPRWSPRFWGSSEPESVKSKSIETLIERRRAELTQRTAARDNPGD